MATECRAWLLHHLYVVRYLNSAKHKICFYGRFICMWLWRKMSLFHCIPRRENNDYYKTYQCVICYTSTMNADISHWKNFISKITKVHFVVSFCFDLIFLLPLSFSFTKIWNSEYNNAVTCGIWLLIQSVWACVFNDTQCLTQGQRTFC